MPSNRNPVSRALAATTALVLGASAVVLGTLPAAAAPPSTVTVTASQISSVRPLTSAGWWYDIGGTSWGFDVTHDGPDNDAAMKLTTQTSTDKVYLYNAYAPDERPVDIPALVSGASYTYAGANVNFQLEVVFEPVDVAGYGPSGSIAACTPASTWYGWGLHADPDWCYTVLKWEPFLATTSWSSQDISQDIASSSTNQTGGWIAQRRVGNIAPPGAFNGQKLSTILAQMADYEVSAIVFGFGSGNSSPKDAWVKEYTVAGTTYRFAAEPGAPAAAPEPDTDALEQRILDDGIDVAQQTSEFVTTGTENPDLNEVDPSKPFSGEYENWGDPSDAFVDVYSYSNAVHLGTFPVVGGDVIVTGLDLSHLQPGTHYLLFQGQNSGDIRIVRFNVLSALAATGGGPSSTLVVTGVLLLAAGTALLLRARRRVA